MLRAQAGPSSTSPGNDPATFSNPKSAIRNQISLPSAIPTPKSAIRIPPSLSAYIPRKKIRALFPPTPQHLVVSAPQTFQLPTSGAESAAQYAKLKEFYRQAETYGSGGIRQLENGRYRFYGDLRVPRTPGEMIGQRTVREWNPTSGNARTWLETLDQSGRVRIVRPETGGLKVHYLFDAEGNYVNPF